MKRASVTNSITQLARKWSSVAIFIAMQVSVFSSVAQLPPGQMQSKNMMMELPLIGTQREILVKAKLKGEEFTFLLDTGAPFFISNAIQDKYNFPVLFKANLSDASGKKDETVLVRVDSLAIGPYLYVNGILHRPPSTCG